MAPSHYLNQSSLLNSAFLWHAAESNPTTNAQATVLYFCTWKSYFKIIVIISRGQWVNEMGPCLKWQLVKKNAYWPEVHVWMRYTKYNGLYSYKMNVKGGFSGQLIIRNLSDTKEIFTERKPYYNIIHRSKEIHFHLDKNTWPHWDSDYSQAIFTGMKYWIQHSAIMATIMWLPRGSTTHHDLWKFFFYFVTTLEVCDKWLLQILWCHKTRFRICTFHY